MVCDSLVLITRNDMPHWLVVCMVTAGVLVLLACMWADDYARKHANQWTKGDAQ